MFINISMKEFISKMDHLNIIDIRSIQSYNNNHIPGAVHIPWEKLIANPSAYINKGDYYYLYCEKGKRSSQVCSILRKMGYFTINIDGGYEEWILQN